MLNISQDAMLRTVIPVPPYSLQMKFEELAWEVTKIIGNERKAGTKIETVWKVLQQCAFSGKLTAKWREGHMQELLAEMAQQARLLNLPLPQDPGAAP